MSVEESYNAWSSIYDDNENKTRDLEALALRQCLAAYRFDHWLEAGCGTGKNSIWLKDRADRLTAVDFSEGMLQKARHKIGDRHVRFEKADLLQPWSAFADEPYDGIGFSLVLEHIKDLQPVFEEMNRVLKPGGLLYIGELHPFRQYAGSKARFDTDKGRHVLACYLHPVSDFIQPLIGMGFHLEQFHELSDGKAPDELPRILALVFRKGTHRNSG